MSNLYKDLAETRRPIERLNRQPVTRIACKSEAHTTPTPPIP